MIKTAVARPEVSKRLSALGMEPLGTTPNEMRAYLAKTDPAGRRSSPQLISGSTDPGLACWNGRAHAQTFPKCWDKGVPTIAIG